MSSILVVDDKAVFRETIAVTLRRQGYETQCAENGLEALQLVRSQRPDLILLDVAMPVMDGLSCPRELRASRGTRDIPVFMLTAASERETVRVAAQIGIQGYLLKSQFSVREMLARVQKHLGPPGSGQPEPQAAASPSTREPPPEQKATAGQPAPTPLKRSVVLARVREEFELRAIPPVLQHVMALTNSTSSSIDEVAEAVQQDQALAVRVLRIANSTFFGAGKAVRTIPDAARRIGMSGVRDAVVALLAIERFSDSGVGGLNAQYFWEHSLGSAILAQLIGTTLKAVNAKHVFLAGLLHDIGRVVLSSRFPVEYEWVLKTAAQRNVDLTVTESEAFGLTHAHITGEFLDRLSVPDVVREAASSHCLGVEGIRRAAGDAQSASIVALASRLAHALLLGDSGNSMLYPFNDWLRALHLDDDRIGSIVEEAVQRAQETKLFYASQSQETFRESLESRIAQTVNRKVPLVVLTGGAAADPLQWFFDRLGWINRNEPELAIVSVASEGQLTSGLAELDRVEGAIGARLPVLLASPGDSVSLPPPQTERRVWATTPIPGRCQQVVDAVVDLAGRKEVTSRPRALDRQKAGS